MKSCVWPKIVPTGIKYGTVTIQYDNKEFEVTTFRTDGQPKILDILILFVYSDNVQDDVMRRFLMNNFDG